MNNPEEVPDSGQIRERIAEEFSAGRQEKINEGIPEAIAIKSPKGIPGRILDSILRKNP